MNVNFEKVITYTNPLSSPVEVAGQLFMVAQNGDILFCKDDTIHPIKTGGQPSSIAVERDLSIIYIADMAHQAIMIKEADTANPAKELIKEYEGQPLLGPNQIIMSQQINTLFFTDSGPFGETQIENPKGSVFMVDLDSTDIKPIPMAFKCLAHPSGLALSQDEKMLYVSETCRNRIIRFVLTNQGSYSFSEYHQFQGRFGPIALAVSQNDLLYVSRFEFAHITEIGLISVINPSGQLIENIVMMGTPEISGMCFSQVKPTMIYITENSNGNMLAKAVIPLEDKDDEKKKKDKENYKMK